MIIQISKIRYFLKKKQFNQREKLSIKKINSKN